MVCWKINYPKRNDFLACSDEAAKWLFLEKSEIAIILKNGIEHEQFAFSDEIRNK